MDEEQYLITRIRDYHDMYEAAVRPYVERLIKLRSIRMGPLPDSLDLQEHICASVKEE